MENRDAVEATVWGAYSIAYADGTCDAKEIATLEKTISALPAFAPFAGEIAQMSSNIRARYEAFSRYANAQALRELADVAGTSDTVDVLCLCLDVAVQDGIGEDEEAALKKSPKRFSFHWTSTCDRLTALGRRWRACVRGCCVSLAAYQIQRLTLCKSYLRVILTECKSDF